MYCKYYWNVCYNKCAIYGFFFFFTEVDRNKEYLPSKVIDEDYIFMPPLPEGFIDSEEWKSSGKWLLYVFGDQEKLDAMWTQLQPLLADGTLSRLKSSTARNKLDGVLMCYTSNSEDKKAVKKAADAIRNIVDFEYIMYYKTNEASESGLYLMHGDNRITKYMHTVACSLYERDKHKRWIKVSIE